MAEPRNRYLTSRLDRGVLVLTITESQLRSANFGLADELREAMLTALAEAKSGKVVVDLTAVEQFGSASFRPLLSLRRKVHEMNGQLVLCGLQPIVREVFLVTRLIDTSGSAAATFAVAADAATAVSRLA
jgi:anti-anti-sigma factor